MLTAFKFSLVADYFGQLNRKNYLVNLVKDFLAVSINRFVNFLKVDKSHSLTSNLSTFQQNNPIIHLQIKQITVSLQSRKSGV
ncbi:MAG: hypothetical protein JWR23_263 [Mucilaginibacter sp.]|nr:hypothetical protein [Mucilaginibacter sp.]